MDKCSSVVGSLSLLLAACVHDSLATSRIRRPNSLAVVQSRRVHLDSDLVHSDFEFGDLYENNMCDEVAVNETLRPLTLIHIPRTGGSTMEFCAVGAPSKHRWGKLQPELAKGVPELETGAFVDPCSGWHTPPNLQSYYNNKETFCSVRNPYERLISQYGWMCQKQYDLRELDGRCDLSVDTMNAMLLQALNQVKSNPYRFDCHFLPQAAFVWGWDVETKTVDRSRKHCDNVLHFEPSLPEAFNELMEEHGYAYRMTNESAGSRTKDSLHWLRPEHLSADVIQLYNELLDVDFELLGFDKL